MTGVWWRVEIRFESYATTRECWVGLSYLYSYKTFLISHQHTHSLKSSCRECRVRLTVNGNEFVAEASSDRGFKPAKQRAALMVLEQAGYRVDYATIAQPNAFAKPRGRGGGRVGGRGGRGRGIPDRI